MKMLNSFCKGICAFAAATTFTATAAMAENHHVLIMEGGYFPAIVYVNRGDNLIFTNQSEQEHVINGPDESWTSGPIAVDATYRLNINNQMAMTFSGLGVDDALMEGEFSYEEAPLSE
jgi:plastocyanin